MIRSGNPELDIFIYEFTERLVKKLRERDSKHGERSITANKNMPSDTGSFKEIVSHLKREIRELHIELHKTQPNTNKIREELIDVVAMCILTDWYIEEGIDTNILDQLYNTLRPDPTKLSEIAEPANAAICFICGRETDGTQTIGYKVVCTDPPCMDMALKGVGGAARCISCNERRECYMYHCNVCGDQEQFDEYIGESTDCGFCRNGDLIYLGLTCRLYDLAMEEFKAKNPTQVPGRELYRAFDKKKKTPEDVN